MDRGTRREFEHVTRRLMRVEDKTRNIPLRVGSGGGGQGGGGLTEQQVKDIVKDMFSATAPQDTGADNNVGESEELSRSDHQHKDVAESLPETVEALPAIPDTGMKEVYWTSTGAGTGDDQVWRAFAGQSQWFPTQRLTDLSGDPGV